MPNLPKLRCKKVKEFAETVNTLTNLKIKNEEFNKKLYDNEIPFDVLIFISEQPCSDSWSATRIMTVKAYIKYIELQEPKNKFFYSIILSILAFLVSLISLIKSFLYSA